jgi:3-deoxy-D-manno-octulosonic-acid transferase
LVFLYNLFISLYGIGVRVLSLWDEKAREWLSGRKSTWEDLQSVKASQKNIWFHVASAGEFEQAKPLIEAIKANYPGYQVIVSFFSPSGYRTATKYQHADRIVYLPVDTKENARRFIQTIQPKLVVFIKYDFWYHHLKAVHDAGIPLLLSSALFYPHQSFFKKRASLHKSMLHFFTQLFVQDEDSLQLLKKHGYRKAQIGGDTRFDRVITIAEKATALPLIEQFVGSALVLIAGSTWPADEDVLEKIATRFPGLKLILAPHEIDEAHIAQIQKKFPKALLYSELNNSSSGQVLIINNIGMLSRLYQYATITYIGGGFSKTGIHNTLEAAVWGKPVLFGPNYKKYKEAIGLITCGGAFSVASVEELETLLERLLEDPAQKEKAANAAQSLIYQHRGATKKLVDYIQENRLLTN